MHSSVTRRRVRARGLKSTSTIGGRCATGCRLGMLALNQSLLLGVA
jgi:hypothetical protein